jgi:hypothetical protein
MLQRQCGEKRTLRIKKRVDPDDERACSQIADLRKHRLQILFGARM